MPFEIPPNLNDENWALYRIRRIYTAKGKADCAVEKLEAGDRGGMGKRLIAAAARHGLKTVDLRGIVYAYVHEREEVYPTVEEFFVAAPARIQNKVRSTMARFEEKWRSVLRRPFTEQDAEDAVAAIKNGGGDTVFRVVNRERSSSEVTDEKEMLRIFLAYSKNGGPFTFQQIERDKTFGLKFNNGMNAYRICMKVKKWSAETMSRQTSKLELP